MTAMVLRTAALGVTLAVSRAPARQRSAADSARVSAERAAWRSLEALEAQERIVLGAERGARRRPTARQRSATVRRDSLLELARARLDTIVAAPWGDSVLADLRASWPRSALLLIASARRDELAGRDTIALRRYTEALRERPADPDLLRSRAAVSQRLGMIAEASRDLSLALELDPGSAAGWRALLALREANGTLDTLLQQVRRLALRLPRCSVAGDHEIEVLQRMGRAAEAAQAARRRQESCP